MLLRLLPRIWRERPDIRNIHHELILIGLQLYIEIFPRIIWIYAGQNSLYSRVTDSLCSPLLHSLQVKWKGVKRNKLARGSLWGVFALKVYLSGTVSLFALVDGMVEFGQFPVGR